MKRAYYLHFATAGGTPGGNVLTLRSGVTSAGQRHESGCDTHAPAASPKSGLLGNSETNFSHRILSPTSAVYLKHARLWKIPFLLFTLR